MDNDAPPAYEAGNIHVSTTIIQTLTELPNSYDDELAPPYIDEDLPRYAPPNVPVYEEPPRNAPLATFTIHQSNRKTRTIIPTFASPGYPSYMITARSSPKMLSRKPDLTLTRLVDTSRTDSIASTISTSSTSSNTTTSSSSTRRTRHRPNKTMAAEIAHLDFTSHTTFPWMPRARIQHLRNPLVAPRTFGLAAPNFADFHVSVGGRPYAWKLSDHPTTSLVLVERGERLVVGELEVFEIPLDFSGDEDDDGRITDELEWVELVIAGLELVMQHWRSMGKHFRNTIRPSNCRIYGTATGSADGREPTLGRF